jgi:hypothetical protein
MELLSILHIPMPILGSLFFLLGLLLIRLAKQAGQRPVPPFWMRHDMTCLVAGTFLSLPLSLGLGFILADMIQLVAGQGGTPIALLAALAITVIGWRGLGRLGIGAQPVQA